MYLTIIIGYKLVSIKFIIIWKTAQQIHENINDV